MSYKPTTVAPTDNIIKHSINLLKDQWEEQRNLYTVAKEEANARYIRMIQIRGGIDVLESLDVDYELVPKNSLNHQTSVNMSK